MKVYTQVTRELHSQWSQAAYPSSCGNIRVLAFLHMLCFAAIRQDFSITSFKAVRWRQNVCVKNWQQRKKRVQLLSMEEASGKSIDQAWGPLQGRHGRTIAQCCWHKRKYLVRYDREITLYVFVDCEVPWTAWAQHRGSTLQDTCYVSRWMPRVAKALHKIGQGM